MTIQALPTRYAGHHFRSRLEARWAVFMDHLDIPWDYEPQGYVVDGKPYLPDFLIYPDTPQKFWLEIKGTFPTDEEVAAAQGLATGTDITTFVYWMKPKPPGPDLSHLSHEQLYGHDQGGYVWLDQYGWREYPTNPPAWELGLTPTAFRLTPGAKPAAKSGFSWWTDCPECGHIRLLFPAQQDSCPSFKYLSDEEATRRSNSMNRGANHLTPRLLAAYDAASSARFEHGQSGA
ncbi:hypothetical protein ACWECC_07105 [Streptomyces microflavus]